MALCEKNALLKKTLQTYYCKKMNQKCGAFGIRWGMEGAQNSTVAHSASETKAAPVVGWLH